MSRSFFLGLQNWLGVHFWRRWTDRIKNKNKVSRVDAHWILKLDRMPSQSDPWTGILEMISGIWYLVEQSNQLHHS